MKVVLDASSMSYQLTGIGYYCHYLYEHILQLQSSYDCELLFSESFIEDPLVRKLVKQFDTHFIQGRFLSHLEPIAFRGKQTLRNIDRKINAWRRQKLPDADLFHAQDLLFDQYPNAANTITIYDLTTVLYPEFHAAVNIERNELRLAHARDRCDIVTCISKKTEEDLLNHLPDLQGRTAIVYPGCHSAFRKAPTQKPNLGLASQPYILSVGTLEPRKNLLQTLSVFERLKAEKVFRDYKLVLVGSSGWGADEFSRKLADHRNVDDIILTGYLDQAELVSLYARAACFMYLSLYEGFGLPVLEAMAAGCPVVASNASSIPEVTLDTALLVDPTNVEDSTEKTRRLLLDETMGKEMSARAKERSQYFNWKDSAVAQLAVYDKVTAS